MFRRKKKDPNDKNPSRPIKRKTKIRKNIKRRPGQVSNLYFHAGTQDAILRYQDSSNAEEREKIYIEEVYPAFDKLVENLIYVHGFTSLYDSYTDLKNDTVTFLYESLDKFKREYGTKSFSYFSICAKNFLIIRSKSKSLRLQKITSIDDPATLTDQEIEKIEKHFTIENSADLENSNEKLNSVERMLLEIRSELKKDSEIEALDCIITLFKDAENLPFHNKRAIFVYLKDMVSNGKTLTASISQIKQVYKKIRDKYKTQIF